MRGVFIFDEFDSSFSLSSNFAECKLKWTTSGVMIELVSSFSLRLNNAETPMPTSSFFPFNSNSVPL